MGIQFIGMACALGLSALGSAFGVGCASLASVGAWKKCYMSNKAAPFILTVFAGAPLTQTIYGFLLMQQMKSAAAEPSFLFGLGIASGLAMAVSAVKVDTASADTNTVYPFETGVNAFEYGVELTVTETEWSVIYYKPYCALQGVAQFQGIQDGGVLALQVSTEQAVAIYMTSWDGVLQGGYALGSAWFMYEDGTIADVYTNGVGIAIPAYASGALILPTNGFGLTSWEAVTLIMPTFHVT